MSAAPFLSTAILVVTLKVGHVVIVWVGKGGSGRAWGGVGPPYLAEILPSPNMGAGAMRANKGISRGHKHAFRCS